MIHWLVRIAENRSRRERARRQTEAARLKLRLLLSRQRRP